MNAVEIQQTSMQTAVAPACGERLPSNACDRSDARDRLDSWKEIACYFRRSIRCVQRWEKTEGMPILRHQHVRGATVYAYREKLDEWWRRGAADI
jgi:hypothetical protein